MRSPHSGYHWRFNAKLGFLLLPIANTGFLGMIVGRQCQVLERIQNFHTLLVGIQHSTIILENSLLPKKKDELKDNTSTLFLGKSICPHKIMHTVVPHSTTWKMETKISTHKKINGYADDGISIRWNTLQQCKGI